MKSNPNKNMLCKSVMSPGVICKRGKSCWFAHTLKELKPDKCKFNEDCVKGRKCTRIHEGESKEEFAERHNFQSRDKMRKPAPWMNPLEFARSVTKRLNKLPPIDTRTNIGALIMKKWGWVEPDKLEVPEFKLATCSFYNERLPPRGIHDRIVFVKGETQVCGI